ncbi:OmpA family protein [Flagellimonas zhangzhouensis]|uniref:Outer membrane protein OmpA n=1 Tax=Flagellimonas zhangzhouensis TaxID=1073328 RepID=A0A1H2US87_9FLAO|nr:OmpA family protein [Allomuricauda zhangzhouensis]SDQ14226.1 Outer membrane protein OmpA [Allomuricauda zhangzhouensis]SDW58991.1 Outer membrane protein OmpA [Allomuricauda zhangzhouensis]
MKRLFLLLIISASLASYSQEVSLVSLNHDGNKPVLKSNSNASEPESKIVLLDTLKNRDFNSDLNETGSEERLIEQANLYFDNMWYAEAARIYDIVLEKTEAKHTSALLSNAGDSHYYTGNLEKAYKWYNELYDLYQNEISDTTYSNFTETLKGTGKYRRAAAIAKLNRLKRDEPLAELENSEPLGSNRANLVTIKNMAINSQYSDFSPMFHKDSEIVYSSAKDSSIFVTRKYKWTNQPFLDLYVAKQKNEDGDLMGSKKFSKKINTKYHEASMAFSPDQKTIYFTRNNYGKKLRRGKNGINHLKIYRSSLVDGEWTSAKELPFNSDDYSTGHPTISPDGKKMYFVSDRPGGFGQTDIYEVDIRENGTFSEPRNLGRSVNTAAKEMFPYIASNALYFSSDRSMGLGGLDVYKSEFTGEVFSVGVNLGTPINSRRDDFSYIIDTKGIQGYFASNRKGGKGDDDIYSFKFTPNENQITGAVTDFVSDEKLIGANISLIGSDGKLIAQSETDENGQYHFENLDPATEYTLKAEKEGYDSNTQTAITQNNENIEVSHKLQKQLLLNESKEALELFEPNNVYFAFDSFEINTSASKELDKLVTAMNANPKLEIKIESHTDAIGNSAYNKYLSDRRAKSTRNYIISQGIDPSRIRSAIGYGEERLLNNCSDGNYCPPDKHQLNRRSEFIILSQ